MGFRSGVYNIVLWLHIACAIIGFGAVFLNGIYGTKAKNAGGVAGHAIAKANYDVSMVGEYFIYAVFILGFALVGLSDKTFKFSQTWIGLAIVIYLIGLGVAHGVLFRNAKRMLKLQEELLGGPPPGAGAGGPPPQVAELERLGKQQAIAGGILNVLLLVIIFLMVFKPGGPSV